MGARSRLIFRRLCSRHGRQDRARKPAENHGNQHDGRQQAREVEKVFGSHVSGLSREAQELAGEFLPGDDKGDGATSQGERETIAVNRACATPAAGHLHLP